MDSRRVATPKPLNILHKFGSCSVVPVSFGSAKKEGVNGGLHLTPLLTAESCPAIRCYWPCFLSSRSAIRASDLAHKPSTLRGTVLCHGMCYLLPSSSDAAPLLQQTGKNSSYEEDPYFEYKRSLRVPPRLTVLPGPKALTQFRPTHHAPPKYVY